MKKNLLTLIVVLLVAGAIAAYFYRNHFAVTDGDYWSLVSQDAALVLELDDPQTTFLKILNNNAIGASFSKISEVAGLIDSRHQLDSLFKDKKYLLDKLLHAPLLVTAEYEPLEEKVNMTLISHLGEYVDMESLNRYLAQKLGPQYAVLKIDILGIPTLKILNGKTNQVWYLAYQAGNLIYSVSLNAMENSLVSSHGDAVHFSQQEDWKRLKKTAGKHVDGRLYLQYRTLAPWLASVSSKPEREKLRWMAQFAEWTETDLIIKNDELLLAGYTSPGQESFLSGMKDQQPIKNTSFNITPFNVNLLLSLGFSDFPAWYSKAHSPEERKKLSADFNFEMDKLAEIISGEVTLVSNAERAGHFEGSTWILVQTSDQVKMAAYLRLIAENSGQSKVNNYNGYVLNYIKGKNLIPGLFGDAFGNFRVNYFTMVGDFVVFANSESSLINLLRYYETGKTLDLNDNFKAFSDNLAPSSNVLLYFKPSVLLGRITDLANEFTSRKLEINAPVVNQMQGAAFQFSAGENLIFTSYYLKQATVVHEENLAMWKVTLDNQIVGKPILVSNHRDRDQQLVVFDDTPAVYLIDSDGKVLWKKRLEGTPFGEIYEVDYYKNGKIQYLFNTNSHIYLYDVEGKSVASYPKKLHAGATSPLSLFDYSGNNDYRMLVAQADKTVNNFTLDGHEVEGWKNPHLQNVANEKVTRLLINGKDYIVITDIDGKVKIVDRQGKDRIVITEKFTKARNSGYYVNRTNSKGIIITTNAQGKLIYISATGKLKSTDFGDYSPEHFFLYEDFNGDGTMDFIYVNGRELKVFDRFKKLLFSYTFNSEITIKPEFFNLGKKQKVMGVVANDEKTIYLFDSKGNTIISTGLVGETPFTVGSMSNDQKINLISAAGNTLYNYRIK